LPLAWCTLAVSWLMLSATADRPVWPAAAWIVSIVGPLIGVRTH
jgi:hypothetical protein